MSNTPTKPQGACFSVTGAAVPDAGRSNTRYWEIRAM